MLSLDRRARVGSESGCSIGGGTLPTEGMSSAKTDGPGVIGRSRPAASPYMSMALLVAGMAAVAIVASMESSPYTPPLLSGGGAPEQLTALARVLGLTGLSPEPAAAVGIGVMAGASAAFLFALRQAWRGMISGSTAVLLAVAFQAAAIALPVLLTGRDVYSYAMYGRIDVVYHANPYVQTPIDFPQDPLVPFVAPEWRNTPSVYGPVFMRLCAAMARITSSPLGLVWAFKLLTGLAVIGTVILIAWMARRVAPQGIAFAVGVFGWNPAIVFYVTGAGHNDALVALCLITALAILVRAWSHTAIYIRAGKVGEPRPWPELAAVTLLTLGTLLKVSVAPALIVAIVASVAARHPGRRIRFLAVEASIVLGISVVLSGPYWQTANPTLGLSALGGLLDWLSPARFLFATGGRMAVHLWGEPGRLVADAAIRGGLALVAATGLVWIAKAVVRRVKPAGSEMVSSMKPTRDASSPGAPWSPAAEGAAWAWALLVVVFASPVIQPWYLAWILPLAWLLPTRVRTVAIGLSVVLAVSYSIAPVSAPSLWHWVSLSGRYLLAPILFVAFGWLVLQTRRLPAQLSSLESPDLMQPGELGVEAPS